MSIEFEIKLRADSATLERLLRQYGAEGRAITMQTTFYDTPSQALSRRRYMLRRRLENGVSVCTLKSPAADQERNELEVICQDIDEAIPQLQALGAPEDFSRLAAEGLIPICGARFTRCAVELQMPDCVAELALDQGVLIGGGQEQPFWEVEVELKRGEREQVRRMASYLAEAYGLTLEERGKFRRALALYKGEVL